MSQGAEFGRRRPDAPAGVKIDDSDFSVAALVKGVFFGVGVILCIGIGYFAVMRGFGFMLDRHWQENVGYPGIEDAYERSSAPYNVRLEQAHNDCESRSDAVHLPLAQARAVEMWDGIAQGEAALARAAYYVDCLAARQPARFCDKAHRDHLVAAVRDYFRLKAKVREEWALTRANPMGVANQLGYMPGRDVQGFKIAMPSEQTDPNIVAGLRSLIANGYITRSDLDGFLGGLPGDLEKALKGAEAKRKSCA
jgi:hypothetical protein